MITNDIVQQDLIASLKLAGDVTSKLGTDEEVREAYYQSKDIAYPNIRVSILTEEPRLESEQCDHSRCTFLVRCYAEDSSSGSCQELAAAVVNYLHKKFINGTGWKGTVRLVTLSGPATIREHLWRVEPMFNVNVYPTA